ncbi:MAG: SDR family oxidoreductase [Spongiibacteraceae bacterium]
MTEAVFGLSGEQLAALPSIYKENLLQGKTAVISGGSGGIGKSIAWLYSRLGAKVVLLGRDAAKLRQVKADIESAGGLVAVFNVNIKDPDAVRAVQQEIIAQQGGFDILVNCAGGQFPRPAIDISDNGWRAVVDTNLSGTWFMMQTAARYWRDQKRAGIIINIVTVVDRGMVDMAHSCAARAGVIHLSKTVAIEWAQYNIRTNCIAPGVIASEGMAVYTDAARAPFPDSNPMKRFGSPWEIAQAAVYYGSDASAFITGDTMTVDGGGRLWGDLWPHGKPDYFRV